MFKLNFNRFFFKNKLPFKKNFFFKDKAYYNNKKLLLDSFLVKDKIEYYFTYNYVNKYFYKKKFFYFIIKDFFKSIKIIFSFKNTKITRIYYKIKVVECECINSTYKLNFYKIKTTKTLKKKKNKSWERLYTKKKEVSKKNNKFKWTVFKKYDNLSFFILFFKKFNKNYINIFNLKKKFHLFKYSNKFTLKQTIRKIAVKNIFKNNFNNNFKLNFYFFNKDYLYFIKTLNFDKIFNKPYLKNTFISFNFIKYYSNQRLVKQPVCILNYKLTSIYKHNNSTRVFKSYVSGGKKNINYHIFLKKFFFNLKKTSYKFFGLNQTYHFFNFLYKTHFKLFV